MGKKSKFTGSKLLGAELRRLRGDRSLAQISALSRSEPLTERINPVSAPALSQIETGVSFPSLDTLHSLATLYQTPMQQLLDFVVQERVLESQDFELPADYEAVKTEFRTAFEGGRWRQAMALAVRGEELGETASERVGWRANRAICLQQFGLRDDAVQMLLGCTSDPDAPEDRLYQLHRSLAEALASSGHLSAAAAIAGRALELAPDDLPRHWRWQLLSTHARLVLMENEARETPDAAGVAKALDQVERALTLVPPEQEQARLLLGVQVAIAQKLSGARERAVTDLEMICSEARAGSQPLARVHAQLALGRLAREDGDLEEAARVLLSAEQEAMDEAYVDEAFEAYFELHLVSKLAEDGKHEYYLKRCRRYYPLVQAKTPQVLAYEKIARSQA
jgi:transcriptional regulator with XRE-family HTH domain